MAISRRDIPWAIPTIKLIQKYYDIKYKQDLMSEIILPTDNLAVPEETREEFSWYEGLSHTRQWADRVAGDIEGIWEESALDPGKLFKDGDNVVIVGTGGFLPEGSVIASTGKKNMRITALDGENHFHPWWGGNSLTEEDRNNSVFWKISEFPGGEVTVKRMLAEQELGERLDTGGELPGTVLMMQMPDLTTNFGLIYDLVAECAKKHPTVFVASGGMGNPSHAFEQEMSMLFPPDYEVSLQRVRRGSYSFPGGHHSCVIRPKGADIFVESDNEVEATELVDL